MRQIINLEIQNTYFYFLVNATKQVSGFHVL